MRQGRTKRKRKKAAKSIKIAYNNIQGKFGRKGLKTAEELKHMADTNSWDIILLTETHRRMGAQLIRMLGFQTFSTERKFDQKKGGGITVFVRDQITAYQWDRNPGGTDESQTQAENMWIIVPTSTGELALGIVYMGVDSTPNTAWNDAIQERILEEGAIHKEQGRQILLVGDFNGHITWKTGPEDVTPLDRNGRRLTSIANNLELHIMNADKICEGKFTWMKRGQQSTIDYVLGGEEVRRKMTSMKIDEDSDKWTIGSDHSFIEVGINGNSKKRATPNKRKRWKITPTTDWKPFQQELSKQLMQWQEQMDDGGEEMIDLGCESARAQWAKSCLARAPK
jgi:exonuclease III